MLILIYLQLKNHASRKTHQVLKIFSSRAAQLSYTELSAGWALLYIGNRLSRQLRNDVKLYHPGKIESTFIVIICSKSTNVIIGWIYKHLTLQINDFTNDFVSSSLLKLQKKSCKRIFWTDDFIIDLLKYEFSDSVNNAYN